MPFYEYQCTACDHRLEALQKISDDPLVDCPSCNAPALKKLISAAAFRLKGTGWYETDFKNNGKKEEKSGDKADNKSDKGEAGTDSGKKADPGTTSSSSDASSSNTSSSATKSEKTSKAGDSTSA